MTTTDTTAELAAGYRIAEGNGCSGNTPYAALDPQGEREGCFESEADAQDFIDDLQTGGDETEMAAAGGEPPRFSAILTVEGVQTADRRYIAPNALDWRDLPLTLMLQKQTPAGGMGGNPHAGAVAAGRIDTIERVDQGDGTFRIVGTGVFDSGAEGQEAARMVGDQVIRGVSVDLGNVTAEPECLEEGDDGECADGRDVYTAGRIMGATITPFQAIEPATISLAASIAVPGSAIAYVDASGHAVTRVVDVAAPNRSQLGAEATGVAPLMPPVEWFQDQHLDRPTPFTITSEGQIFAHLAQWGQCHLGFVNQAFNKCVTVPTSKTGYALFAKPGGQLAQCCGDCEPQEVTVGTLTFGTTHADLSMPWKYANEFYEHTGKVAAHVAIGEDEHGVWIAGALNPALSAQDVWTLRGAKISGDWRRYGGALELVSILCVNTPGFPVGAPKIGFGSDGVPMALVASLAPQRGDDTVEASGPAWSDFNALRGEIAEVRDTNARLTAVVDTLGLTDQAAAAIEDDQWADLADLADLASLAAQSAASTNDLPDSAFAYIEPGGTKDEAGKTTPRALRHFPIHDAAHVRNALARAPQSPFGGKAMPAIRAAAKKFGIKVADD